MLGGELLVTLAQRQRLGGLNETARAVGVFFEIHASTPSAHDGTGKMNGSPKAARPSFMWVRLLPV